MLDLCCGSGDMAFLLSQKVGPDGQVLLLPILYFLCFHFFTLFFFFFSKLLIKLLGTLEVYFGIQEEFLC